MTDRRKMLSNNSHTRIGLSAFTKAAMILVAFLAAGPMSAVRAATAPLYTMTGISSGQGDVNTYSIGYVFTTSNPSSNRPAGAESNARGAV